MPDFTPFPKMARLSRECVVTEKIDGTNAQIVIFDPEGEFIPSPSHVTSATDADGKLWFIRAASRTRFIHPDSDNFGFARWVWENAPELVKLGEGSHFGEWYGAGIQRNYGLKEKRFALFNTARWDSEDRPACCGVVPTLYRGVFDTAKIEESLDFLRGNGSVAVPGFPNPEGVVVYHEAARVGFKKTLDNDAQPKSLL